jgi:calcineurin-like phosphoesterase family protein
MIYFTSDLHFCHDKPFIYEPRGFASVEEMNLAIVDNWNSIVNNEDEVYVLGDLMLCDNDIGIELLKQLKGKIHVICGNHDSETRQQLYRELPNVVSIEYATEIKYSKAYFFLCHYKTATANYDDQKAWAKHLISLHGHTHSKEKFEDGNPYQYNVALDAHNNKLVSIEEIIEDIKQKQEEVIGNV